ncbi:MAG: hypothetical protein NTY32_08455, partial [Bacteroidia bacterium]|nr:hypothetical protein [Bacteroidia bacterium]
PSEKIYLDVDKDQVVKNKYMDAKYDNNIVPRLNINLAGKQYLGKQEIMILEMLKENKWQRPIYYAVTVEESQFLGLQSSFLQEGLAYKLTPMRSASGKPTVNTDKMYDLMINKFKYGNIQDKNVYLDENNLRMCRTHRAMFVELIQSLYAEGKNDKAEKAADFCQKMIPMTTVQANYHNVDIANIYYRLGKPEKAFPIIQEVARICMENLEWTYSLKPKEYQSASMLVNTNLYTLQQIVTILEQFDKTKVNQYMSAFQKYGQVYQQYSAMRGGAGGANQ